MLFSSIKCVFVTATVVIRMTHIHLFANAASLQDPLEGEPFTETVSKLPLSDKKQPVLIFFAIKR